MSNVKQMVARPNGAAETPAPPVIDADTDTK